MSRYVRAIKPPLPSYDLEKREKKKRNRYKRKEAIIVLLQSRLRAGGNTFATRIKLKLRFTIVIRLRRNQNGILPFFPRQIPRVHEIDGPPPPPSSHSKAARDTRNVRSSSSPAYGNRSNRGDRAALDRSKPQRECGVPDFFTAENRVLTRVGILTRQKRKRRVRHDWKERKKSEKKRQEQEKTHGVRVSLIVR